MSTEYNSTTTLNVGTGPGVSARRSMVPSAARGMKPGAVAGCVGRRKGDAARATPLHSTCASPGARRFISNQIDGWRV